ncbi:10954_t:CDS:10 [Funneliformis caledonium]|uniref:10954_t:CDS:1 n=1 Tax=Funneliformis caledonium TaxID=1117310 RepID=A0A9N9A9D2_9GLOM|nr:10954_t:CDS:10 [Funneliformis caledonium]
MSQTQFVLNSPPPSWIEGEQFRIHCGISGGFMRKIEPIGNQFLAHARRKLNNHSFSEDDRIQAESAVEQAEEVLSDDSEEETPDLLNRDPKDWKEQDHYAVLGLSKYRWIATDEQIKHAHRKKVLKHHPDKKASSGNTNDDAFFKCIQKAHEVLSDSVKRRQFDSVDEAIDDTPPSIKAKGDFFELYGPVFEREARFSNKTPVPMLGDINTPKSEVETFYDFWYNFDSWRSFEYLDKEDTDNQTLSLDPRIIKFKQEEKAARDAKKKEKEEAAKRAGEAARKAAEEEKQKKEIAEAEAKQKQAEEKKEKTVKKKAVRNERKNIKTHVKNYNYFYPDNQTPPVDIIDIQLSELDSLFENLSLEDLQNVRKQLDSAEDHINEVVVKEVTPVEKPVAKEEPKERPWSVEEISLLVKAANKFPGGTVNRWEKISDHVAYHTSLPPRPNDELIKKSKDVQKGANALEEDVRQLQHQKKHTDVRITDHPSMREATINYDEPVTTSVEPRNKSKSTQKAGKNKAKKATSAQQPIASTSESAEIKETSTKAATTISKEKSETKASANGIKSTSDVTTSPSSQSAASWTAVQQSQLERALQTYPPTWKGDGDRWDKIAAAVEEKTKKECKLRVKVK